MTTSELSTGTSIKSGGVKLLLWEQTSPRSEQTSPRSEQTSPRSEQSSPRSEKMRSCKCFTQYCRSGVFYKHEQLGYISLRGTFI